MPPEAAPLHEISTIETPEQIELELPLAGVGTRALAYLIDLLWQTVPIIAAVFLAVVLLPSGLRSHRWVETDADGQPRFSLLLLAFVNAVIFCVNFGYFAVFEVLWKGQSPGKRSLGLRVVRDGGYPIDGRGALVRNLLRVVDFLPAFYCIGMVSLFAGRKGKRVGDYAAGTFVVKEHKVASDGIAVVLHGDATALPPAEQRLVAEFLVRRSTLASEVRARVAREVANRVAERLGQPHPSDPEQFLAELQAR